MPLCSSPVEMKGYRSSVHSFRVKAGLDLAYFTWFQAQCFTLELEIHGSKFQSKIGSSRYCQDADSLNCYFLLFHIYPDLTYFLF